MTPPTSTPEPTGEADARLVDGYVQRLRFKARRGIAGAQMIIDAWKRLRSSLPTATPSPDLESARETNRKLHAALRDLLEKCDATRDTGCEEDFQAALEPLDDSMESARALLDDIESGSPPPVPEGPLPGGDDLRERLAALCHTQWSGWMKYLFGKCGLAVNAGTVIPPWAVERWHRQMVTPYAELSEEEKDSDRAEADRFIALLSSLSPVPAAPSAEHEYALRLATVMARKHWPEIGGWKPLPDLMGLLTQIDNMVAGMVRRPAPVPAAEDVREAAEALLEGIKRQTGPVSPYVAMKANQLRKALSLLVPAPSNTQERK